jgi:hypothetical protein
MLDWSEQLGIDSCQSCQCLGIQAVVFPTALTDQLHLPGVGDNDLMAKCVQQSTYPRGMCSNLNGDSTTFHRSKNLGHRFLAGADSVILNHVAFTIQHAVAAMFVTQVHADRS